MPIGNLTIPPIVAGREHAAHQAIAVGLASPLSVALPNEVRRDAISQIQRATSALNIATSSSFVGFAITKGSCSAFEPRGTTASHCRRRQKSCSRPTRLTVTGRSTCCFQGGATFGRYHRNIRGQRSGARRASGACDVHGKKCGAIAGWLSLFDKRAGRAGSPA